MWRCGIPPNPARQPRGLRCARLGNPARPGRTGIVLKGSPFGKFSEAHQRRRATAIAHRNATNRLVSGAAWVMLAMVESGLPGRRASATASLSRSAAVLRAPVTSPIVRDTSVAVSMARSAMPGCGINCGVSMLTGNYSRRVGNKRGRHLWLSARALVFEQRAQRTFGYLRQAPW
jgi:hypothetical protein